MYSNPVYYDLAGNQISRERHEQRAVLDKVPVFFDDINGVGVETRFYGVDFDHEQTPMFFTTSIVDPMQPERHEWENHVITYTQSPTYASAQAAHTEAVSRLVQGVSVFNDTDDDKALAEMQDRIKNFVERENAVMADFDGEISFSEDQRDMQEPGLYERISQAAERERKAMDQGPPRDQTTPYKREIIGEFSLKSPLTIKGKDHVEYTVPAGKHSIVGAVSLDGYELRDAAIVYDPGKISPETGKRIFIPEPLHVPELAAAQKKGLVKIDEPHEHKVAEAIARVTAPAARHDERDLAAVAKASLRNEKNRHDERDVKAASKVSMKW